MAAFKEASARFETTVAKGGPADLRAGLAELGKACGGCHERFRKPKAKDDDGSHRHHQHHAQDQARR